MDNIRILPHQSERVETGPVQFGDDWPGVFIRGDNAAYYALQIRLALDIGLDKPEVRQNLTDLLRELSGCLVGPAASMLETE